MKKKGKFTDKEKIKICLNELDAIPDDQIDYSDIPELGESFFKNAKFRDYNKKVPVSIRIDAKVFNWFKSKNRTGYQTHINRVLKSYVEHVG